MKKIIYIFFAVFFVLSCKDTTDDGPIGNPNRAQDPPEGVLLVFPYEDTLCNEGTDLTPTESTVFFEWVHNDNAENYTLTIENLDSGAIAQYETSEFIFPVTIQRAVAYRWFVEYDLQGETKQSAIWNFYNAGPGIQIYAPFPADLILPIMAENLPITTSSVTLQWSGSDLDNDIVAYDVYFDTNNPPTIDTTDLSVEELTVSVQSGTIYYWRIVTKDAEGNSSESDIYQFRVLD